MLVHLSSTNWTKACVLEILTARRYVAYDTEQSCSMLQGHTPAQLHGQGNYLFANCPKGHCSRGSKSSMAGVHVDSAWLKVASDSCRGSDSCTRSIEAQDLYHWQTVWGPQCVCYLWSVGVLGKVLLGGNEFGLAAVTQFSCAGKCIL